MGCIKTGMKLVLVDQLIENGLQKRKRAFEQPAFALSFMAAPNIEAHFIEVIFWAFPIRAA